MRGLHLLSALFLIMILATSHSVSIAQEEGMVPATEEGEDLDLNGVVSLFKESETLEEFEEKLNSEESEVNNLDLNKDNEIDYLRVLESVEGNTHLIVVQAALGDNAYQDVCTIEVEENEDGNTYVQIVGDKAIYGDSYILEPEPEDQEKVNTTAIVVVFFGPGYRPWRSPYRWGFYPPWWRPRPPIARATYKSRMRSKYRRVGRWKHTQVRRSRTARTMHSRNRATTNRARTTKQQQARRRN